MFERCEVWALWASLSIIRWEVSLAELGVWVVLGSAQTRKRRCEFNLGHNSKQVDQMLENCREKEVSLLYIYLIMLAYLIN